MIKDVYINLMTEFPILASSNTYYKNLIYGVNPITGEVLPEDNIVSYNYVPSLFVYIADYVSNAMENIDKLIQK